MRALTRTLPASPTDIFSSSSRRSEPSLIQYVPLLVSAPMSLTPCMSTTKSGRKGTTLPSSSSSECMLLLPDSPALRPLTFSPRDCSSLVAARCANRFSGATYMHSVVEPPRKTTLRSGCDVAARGLDEAVLVGCQPIALQQPAVGVAFSRRARHELIVGVAPPLAHDEIARRSRPGALATGVVPPGGRRHIPLEERNAANCRQHPDGDQELARSQSRSARLHVHHRRIPALDRQRELATIALPPKTLVGIWSPAPFPARPWAASHEVTAHCICATHPLAWARRNA